MATFNGNDMKHWREMRKMTAADLAERISCDTTTIYRYESGKLKPNPDVMYQICEVLGDADRWTTWMRTEYPASYGRMHPETPSLDIAGALLSLFAEMDDVKDLQTPAMKDGSDGRIDDPKLQANLSKEVDDLLRSAQRLRTLLKER